jgi:hypothetical protein
VPCVSLPPAVSHSLASLSRRAGSHKRASVSAHCLSGPSPSQPIVASPKRFTSGTWRVRFERSVRSHSDLARVATGTGPTPPMGVRTSIRWLRRTSARLSGGGLSETSWSVGVGASRLLRVGSAVSIGGWGQLSRVSSRLTTNTLGIITFPPPLVEERFYRGTVGVAIEFLGTVSARVKYEAAIGYSSPAILIETESIAADRAIGASLGVSAPIPYFRRWRIR